MELTEEQNIMENLKSIISQCSNQMKIGERKTVALECEGVGTVFSFDCLPLDTNILLVAIGNELLCLPNSKKIIGISSSNKLKKKYIKTVCQEIDKLIKDFYYLSTIDQIILADNRDNKLYTAIKFPLTKKITQEQQNTTYLLISKDEIIVGLPDSENNKKLNDDQFIILSDKLRYFTRKAKLNSTIEKVFDNL